MKRNPIYGLMAEFDSPGTIIAAANKTYAAGYKKIDAYSPFPIEELSEAIGFHRNGVAPVVLTGGILGCLTGYIMQWWIATVSYPINVGGRPYHSWPSFIVVTFELTILFSVLAAVFGMLALNGLPMPYHPVFNVERFALASKDRFFLIIFSSDPKYSSAETRAFLESLGPRSVSEVPA
jgi:ActD protein